MIKIHKNQIFATAKIRPKGYLKDIFAYSKDCGDYVEMTEENFAKIRLKYRKPSILQLGLNFTRALWSFLLHRDRRSPAQVIQCNKICVLCDHWIEKPNRCGVCGCFLKLKTLVKAWKCPKNKWPE